MPLRLIETVLSEKDGEDALELLKELKVLEHRQVRLLNDEVLVRILLDAAQSEEVLDLLEKRFSSRGEGCRIVILPVEATLPRAEPEPKPKGTSEKPIHEEKSPERIGREELYEDIKNSAQCSRVYLAMVVLSTVVAIVGLRQNSVAIIVGAMVIAPLLGPNMAISLGTTLGDLSLLFRALLTALIGIVIVMVLSGVIGTLIHVDITLSEMVSRSTVGFGDIILALASGCAGALAFTSGVSAALVGVMVAVALLPPLVTSGLLFGGGQFALAIGAFSLFMMNLICVNLAGVVTFLARGIRPASWWEEDRAKKATRIAIVLWVMLLVALISLMLLMRMV